MQQLTYKLYRDFADCFIQAVYGGTRPTYFLSLGANFRIVLYAKVSKQENDCCRYLFRCASNLSIWEESFSFLCNIFKKIFSSAALYREQETEERPSFVRSLFYWIICFKLSLSASGLSISASAGCTACQIITDASLASISYSTNKASASVRQNKEETQTLEDWMMTDDINSQQRCRTWTWAHVSAVYFCYS